MVVGIGVVWVLSLPPLGGRGKAWKITGSWICPERRRVGGKGDEKEKGK